MQIIEIALLVLVMGIIMLMYAYICASEAIKKSRSRALRNQKKFEEFFGVDPEITLELETLNQTLHKVPDCYFDKEKLGQYYIPVLLSLLEGYSKLLQKDEKSKTDVLKAIEVVRNVSKSILDDLDKSKKRELEITFDDLNQTAKMDSYKDD